MAMVENASVVPRPLIFGKAGSRPTKDDPPFDNWRRSRAESGTARIVELVRAEIDGARTRQHEETYEAIFARDEETGQETFVGYQHIPKPKRRRKAKDQATFEVVTDGVICALVHRHLTAPGGCTKVPLSHARLGVRGRCRSAAMSRSLMPLVHAMEEQGFLRLHQGRSGKKRSHWSGMQAGARLSRMVEEYGAALEDFERAPAEELVILEGHQRWLEYEDTTDTVRIREELREIDAWLRTCDINRAGVPLITPGSPPMRRHFAQSFEQGGRLFGPWSTQKPWRWADLRINGEACAVVSHRACLLHLAYAEAGEQPPEDDLLDGIEGLPLPECRDAIELLVSVLLFMPEGAALELPEWLRLMLPKGAHRKKLLKAICDRHGPVAHLFGSQVGHRLIRRVSDIMVEVMRRCMAQGEAWLASNLPVLPLHDAVVSAGSRAEQTRRIMLEVFAARTGCPGDVVVHAEAPDFLDRIFDPTPLITDKSPEMLHFQTTIRRWLNPRWSSYAMARKAEYRQRAIDAARRCFNQPVGPGMPDKEGDWV